MESSTDAIVGNTNPNNIILATSHLWKKRGGITAAMTTNYAERLFVLTDVGIFWYQPGCLCEKEQHGRIELRHIQNMRPLQAGGATAASSDELERVGPKHLLEISHIMSDTPCLIGATDPALVSAWHEVLVAATDRAARGPAPGAPLAVPPSLLHLELTGVVAVGTLGKARQAMTGAVKSGLEHAGVLRNRTSKEGKAMDGWSTRCVVLTEGALHFYKPVTHGRRPSDQPPASGQTPRSGDHIFGKEVGRMPLAHADVHAERVLEDGVVYTYLSINAATTALTTAASTFARAFERSSDRFKALLRTSDEGVAAEWLAVLRTVCGRQSDRSIQKLQAAIQQGEVHAAARMAEELASLKAAVPGGRGHAVSPVASGRQSGRVIEVAARPHVALAASASSAEESEADIPEVEVFLQPSGPSEKKRLRDELTRAQGSITTLRAALAAAQGALEACGRPGPPRRPRGCSPTPRTRRRRACSRRSPSRRSHAPCRPRPRPARRRPPARPRPPARRRRRRRAQCCRRGAGA